MTIRGTNLVLWHRDANRLRADLNALKARGYNRVAFHHTYYVALDPQEDIPNIVPMRPPPSWDEGPEWVVEDIGQNPAHPFHNSTSLPVVKWALRYAKKIGLNPINKCALNGPPGSWQGFFSIFDAYQSPPRWDVSRKFLDEYWLRLVKPNAELCKSTGTMLCFGVEMRGWTLEEGPAWLMEIIRRIRTVAPNIPLTYAANHGDEWAYLMQSGFWSWFLAEHPGNVRGLDLYTPIADHPTGDIPTLTEGATRVYDMHFAGDSTEDMQRSLLTEFGYPSIPSAAVEPWGVAEYLRPPTPDYATQTACFEAWQTVFSQVGALVWQCRAENQNDQHDISLNPQAERLFLGRA
jgi:hypothetical protein